MPLFPASEATVLKRIRDLSSEMAFMTSAIDREPIVRDIHHKGKSFVNINKLCHKREEFNVIVTKNGDYRNIEPEFVLQFQAPLSHG